VRAKHRLSKFLLRQGRYAPVGARAWSVRYQAWLNRLHFEHEADQVVFDDHRAVVQAAGERIRRLEGALQASACASAGSQTIAALQAFRGVGFLSGATIVAEVGDFRRFASAPQFMAYTGLVPSEASSGPTHHRGRITKTGNSLLRHVLGDAAHHARHPPAVSVALRQRQATVPAQVVELSWRAQVRLHQRYRHLSGRIETQKTIIAVARELAGFVWALGQQLEEASAGRPLGRRRSSRPRSAALPRTLEALLCDLNSRC
jgi:transposase